MSDAVQWPLVWVDLEMTGLDPEREVIVEIAVIVTDGQLSVLHEGPDLVLGAEEDLLAAMHPRVKEMHKRSGLITEIRASEVTAAQAEAEVLAFIKRYVPAAGSAPLAGNSVHADRAFLKKYMPKLEGHLHYRNVDVSTIKELARRWYPDAVEAAPPKGGDHRALADIRESINELAHYRQAVFIPPPA